MNAIKLSPILLSLIITGCSTTAPVVARFPAVPEKLLQKCPQLEKLVDQPKLSDISKTVANNYTSYYECAVKNDSWIEWYQSQKSIFEKVK
jgi:hypothetical protein